MPLRPVPSETDWPAEIAESAREEFVGVIDVIAPGTPGTYDPVANTETGGTEDEVVITGRAARIQHIRLPLEQAGAYEWGIKRRYRFQIELETDDPLITKGMIVRVSDGGRDPSLTSYTFQVVSASNSSHAAIRTIETLTEYGVVGG